MEPGGLPPYGGVKLTLAMPSDVARTRPVVAVPGSIRSDQSSTDEASSHYCAFVEGSRDQLRRALVAHHGPEVGVEALADAYAHAWQHWDRVSGMENPTGFVFRVADRIGVRRSMRAAREQPGQFAVREPTSPDETDTNTQLASLLSALPQRQRAAVLLVHGFGWSYKEAARIIGVPVTTLTNDVNRGLESLRAHTSSYRAEMQ